jgi:hypothetical protein
VGPVSLDLVMPVYNEGANIGRALAEIYERVVIPKRVLVRSCRPIEAHRMTMKAVMQSLGS